MKGEKTNGKKEEDSPPLVKKQKDPSLADIEEAIPDTTMDQKIIDRVLDKTRLVYLEANVYNDAFQGVFDDSLSFVWQPNWPVFGKGQTSLFFFSRNALEFHFSFPIRKRENKNLTTRECHSTYQYTLFQNGHHLSILLFLCKLALMASFKVKYSIEFDV